MDYEVFPAALMPTKRRSFSRPNWPTEDMHAGHAFFVPLVDDRDPDGRTSAYVRQIAHKQGKQMGRRFAVNVVEGGLMISRTS